MDTIRAATKLKIMVALGGIAFISSMLMFGNQATAVATPQGHLKVTSKAQTIIVIDKDKDKDKEKQRKAKLTTSKKR